MRQYIDVVQDVQGNALVGVSILVQNYVGGGNASIYSDNGLTPISNSTVTSGSDGSFSFFAADGDYNLVFSKNSTVYKTQSPVSLFDGAAQLTFSDTGTVNTYAISNNQLEKALRSGLRASVLLGNSNTGPSTLQYNGLTAKSIIVPGGTAAAFPSGAMLANGIYTLEYDGTYWQLKTPTPTTPFIAQTAAETAAGLTIKNYARQNSPIYDMSRYGLWDNIANGGPASTDVNSPIVEAAFKMAATTGGTLVFPYGDYSFYLDLSGYEGIDVYIEGNGSTFRPYSATPTQSTIIYANNNPSATNPYQTASTGWGSTQTRFHNINFNAAIYSGASSVNHCVLFNGAAAKFFDCAFFGGKISSFYAIYGQYNEFYSCYWGGTTGTIAATFTAGLSGSSGGTLNSAWNGPTGTWPLNTSLSQVLMANFTYGSTAVTWSTAITGSPTANATVLFGHCVLLQSTGLSAATNEVLFDRCQLFSSNCGIYIQGGQKIRIRSCTMQNFQAVTGWIQQGVVSLQADSTGQFSGACTIWDCWFEQNSTQHINGGGTQSTLVDGCVFWATGGTNTSAFGTSANPVEVVDLKVVNCSWLGGGTPLFSVYQTPSNTNNVSFTWRGNRQTNGADFFPTTFSLIGSAGASVVYADIHYTGSFTISLTGCTTTPTATAFYTIEGDWVKIAIPSISATNNNSTSATLTGLPSMIQPANTWYGGAGTVVNNGGYGNGPCSFQISGGTITIYYQGNPTGFTSNNTATKGLFGGVIDYPMFA